MAKTDLKAGIRPPAVAGQFYPGTASSLHAQVQGFLSPAPSPEKALAVVLPHAGYVYSGSVAAQTVSAVEVPERIVVLGPNHTGWGPPVSVFPDGAWLMPFGEVKVDTELAAGIIMDVGLAEADKLAHQREHSIEVQLPFLHYRRGKPFTFVPVTLSMLTASQCEEVGMELAAVVDRAGGGILLVASSDMTHYESAQQAKGKDTMAIERILALDPQGLLKTVFSHRISMCGVIPTAVMLHAALALGATRARLVRYTNSGEASGDYDQVVGYAGIVIQ